MKYYSAIKINEILPFATTWMELEGIMLSELSQTEKDKYFIATTCGIFFFFFFTYLSTGHGIFVIKGGKKLTDTRNRLD